MAVVDADGDIVVRLQNNTGMPLQLDNLSVQVAFLMPDGKERILGEVE